MRIPKPTERPDGQRNDPKDVEAKKTGESSPARSLGPIGKTVEEIKELRKLGIDPVTGQSMILDLLGADRFVKVRAVRSPNAKVLYFDPDLARLMGFDVPPSNKLTKELEKQILDCFAYTILQPGEDPGGRPTVDIFVDRYGGTGIGSGSTRTGGSGRAGFFPYLNAAGKGLHNTPLAKFDPTDPVHTHGLLISREAGIEGTWGLVGSNLLTQGASRTLAVLDLGESVQWPDNTSEPACLSIRVGLQARPAHALETYSGGGSFTASVFMNAAYATGTLVTDKGVPDLAATAREMIGRQARSAAELERWRILHGAISTSNMLFSGEEIDLPTMMSQWRTGPIQALADSEGFGDEYLARAGQLATVYQALRKQLSPEDLLLFSADDVDFQKEMSTAFAKQYEVQLLRAVGLKEEAALHLQNVDSASVKAFTEQVRHLAQMANPGETQMLYRHDPGLSVVDVFNVLRRLPGAYFAQPRHDLTDKIVELLDPIVRDQEEKNLIVEQVGEEASALGILYRTLMKHAEKHCAKFYDGAKGMQRSIEKRAAFENTPLDALTHDRLTETMCKGLDDSRGWRQSNDPYLVENSHKPFSDAIEKTAAASARNVEMILRQGDTRPLGDGGLELERRTVDGVRYAVRAWPSGKRIAHVAIPLSGNEKDGYRSIDLDPPLEISAEEAKEVVFKYTTDQQKTWNLLNGQIELDEDGRPTLAIEVGDLSAFPGGSGSLEHGEVAHLEGLFLLESKAGFYLKDAGSNFRGYTFAIPDQLELAELSSSAI